MPKPLPDERPLVVCPLEFERQALHRAGLGGMCELHCSGPGADAIAHWAARVQCRARAVILAGVAGSLHEIMKVGTCVIADEVIDSQSSSRWHSTLPAYGKIGTQRARITSSDAIVTTTTQRTHLRRLSGADLVDCESVSFARCAVAAGWSWTIVRGISDGPGCSLPSEAQSWIDARGRTRLGYVAWSLVKNPMCLPAMLQTATASRQAMRAVAQTIMVMIAPPPLDQDSCEMN